MCNNRIIMAPLRGITTYTFRNHYRKYFSGITEAISPFISTVQKTKVSKKLARDILPENNINSYPLVPQILGNNADDLPPFIDIIKSLGYNEINWNLGCPAPMITKKIKGSGLLPHKDKVERYLEKLANIEGISYTVKVRSGLEDNSDIFKLLPLFKQYNCKEITVHPRTGKQLYKGFADRSIFEDIYNTTDIPLIYNGDIFSLNDYREIIDKFPKIKGVMVGRGILINPFLPAQIMGEEIGPNANEIIKAYMNTLFDLYDNLLFGPLQVMGKMKELWKFLSISFPGSERSVKKILKATSIDKYRNITSSIFNEFQFVEPKVPLELEKISGFH